jgi:hypothetical protein
MAHAINPCRQSNLLRKTRLFGHEEGLEFSVLEFVDEGGDAVHRQRKRLGFVFRHV